MSNIQSIIMLPYPRNTAQNSYNKKVNDHILANRYQSREYENV